MLNKTETLNIIKLFTSNEELTKKILNSVELNAASGDHVSSEIKALTDEFLQRDSKQQLLKLSSDLSISDQELAEKIFADYKFPNHNSAKLYAFNDKRLCKINKKTYQLMNDNPYLFYVMFCHSVKTLDHNVDVEELAIKSLQSALFAYASLLLKCKIYENRNFCFSHFFYFCDNCIFIDLNNKYSLVELVDIKN